MLTEIRKQVKNGELKRLMIKAQPGSRENKVKAIESNGVIKIAVTVVPEKGKANEKLLEVLAKELVIAKTRLSIVKGGTGKHKIVQID